MYTNNTYRKELIKRLLPIAFTIVLTACATAKPVFPVDKPTANVTQSKEPLCPGPCCPGPWPGVDIKAAIETCEKLGGKFDTNSL